MEIQTNHASHPDYNSPVALKLFLDENGMSMQKKFGQNFLVNGDARRSLVDALGVSSDSSVWEVGPGLGSMTDELLRREVKLTAFEIDHGFARLVKQFFSDYESNNKFKLVEGDVLKTWKQTADDDGIPQFFFGNLPYNIAATIIADTINEGIRFEKMLVTVQKEVGQRMSANPGTEDYSSFSVLCQWAYDVKPVMDLAGGNFWPRPNVSSRAVLMTKKTLFPQCENPQLFMKMIRALFASRRKTIRNNLSAFTNSPESASGIISSAGLDESLRAESIAIPQLLALSDALNSYILSQKAL